MQYSNEVKVGAALILTALAAFLGVRFLQELPLFGDSYVLHARFENAGGLTSGKPVRMKGVNVGSVASVRLDQTAQIVRARLRIKKGIQIPKGSHAQIVGLSAFGGVRVTIKPGPSDNPPLPPGATLTDPPGGTVLERLRRQAPRLAAKANSVLTNTNQTMAELSQQLQNPKSDLRQALSATKGLMSTLERITTAEKDNIRALLQNLRAVSSDLRRFTQKNRASIDSIVRRLNQSLDRLNQSLASFERTAAALDTLTTKLNEGDGTIGRLINDPSLYMKLDSAATRVNRLLRDFKRHPGRYLDDMTLVKVF